MWKWVFQEQTPISKMSKYFTPTSLGGEHLKIVQLTRCVQKQA